jgi:hypothetical protein
VFLVLPRTGAAAPDRGAVSNETLLAALRDAGHGPNRDATAAGVPAALLTELLAHPRCDAIVALIRSAVLLERQQRAASARDAWLAVLRVCSRERHPRLYEHARIEIERLLKR